MNDINYPPKTPFPFRLKTQPERKTRKPEKSKMAFTESESPLLLPSGSGTKEKAPEDKWHLAYMIYFFLGFGYLLPWNAFITAVDYFSYLYPDASVDRIFAVVYMLVGLFGLTLIILYRHKSQAYVRINLGLALFVVSLLVVPLIDAFYVKGRVGFYGGFYVTAGAVGIAGVADALVQGSIVGSAGELPERYMQAVIAGTAASGIEFILYFVTIFALLFFAISDFSIFLLLKIETL